MRKRAKIPAGRLLHRRRFHAVIHTFVTDKPAWNSEMAISADGRYLAYERPQEKILRTETFTSSTSNTSKRNLWFNTPPMIDYWAGRPTITTSFSPVTARRDIPVAFHLEYWDAYLLPMAEGVGRGRLNWSSVHPRQDQTERIHPERGLLLCRRVQHHGGRRR